MFCAIRQFASSRPPSMVACRAESVSPAFSMHRSLGGVSNTCWGSRTDQTQVLGPARDWDVFVTTTLARLEKACTPDIDFTGLRRAAEPHRIASYAALREALMEPRYTRFQLSLRRWIERRDWRTEIPSEVLETLTEPVSALAGRVLTRLHCKALREGARFERLQNA
jgi:CHAD domain-containing protein